nr:stage VI sporulation protein F [Paenibacillus lutrae]
MVERIKTKMKKPEVKERVKGLLQGVTKSDLQNRQKVASFVSQLSKIVGEPLTQGQAAVLIDFVIAQKIDPNNTFHLLKLWGMFR